MARRIVSARDQVELLSPWRTAQQLELPGMPEPYLTGYHATTPENADSIMENGFGPSMSGYEDMKNPIWFYRDPNDPGMRKGHDLLVGGPMAVIRARLPVDGTRVLSDGRQGDWYISEAERIKDLKRHAAAEPQKLYRGMRVNLPPELVAEMKEKLVAPTSVEKAGRELDLGPKILAHLSSQPWQTAIRGGHAPWTGLGPNWHPNPKKAHEAAYGYYDAAQQGTPWSDGTRADWPLMITAETDHGAELDPRTDHLAGEVHFPQGHPLKITSLVLQPEIAPDGTLYRRPANGGNSIELLHNPIYERHGIHPGAPQTHTASRRLAERADDFRWERSFDGGGGWILVTRTPDGNPVTVATSPTRGQRTSAVDKTPEQHLRDTYEPYPPGSPGLPDSLKPHLMLPTEIAHHYREYDRPDDENTQMLKRVIADQGIRQPLKISTDGTHAMLIEGNHRVNVARQLGMSHVPVQVFMEKPGEVMTNSKGSKPVSLEPVLGGWVDKNRHRMKSFWS